jgi:two-component system chemotaxis response regulator CheB
MVTGSVNTREKSMTARAAKAGALAVLSKPFGPGQEEYTGRTTDFVQAVKLMSEVKVLTRWKRTLRTNADRDSVPVPANCFPTRKFGVLAIGASTGGPPALQIILSRIPKDFSVPVLLVQHIALGFIDWFVQWLRQGCSLSIKLASHGDLIRPGYVYVAPDDAHMSVAAGGRLWLTKNDLEYGPKPSVSHLFRSVTETYGKNAIGVLLSGMGKDGARELKLMKDRGAVTLVQDKESSVVHGMPGEAIRLGAASYILSPDRLADSIVSLAYQEQRRWKL